MSATSKPDMLKSLPLREGKLTIRALRRGDLDILAKWPGYPFPYESFNLSFGKLGPEERDRSFQSREDDPNKITLVIDHERQKAVGYLSLKEIDWDKREVGNTGFRIIPSWCDRGLGTQIIRKVVGWCFSCGIKKLRFDVAASNERAIRCYEKAGFVKTKKFWKDDKKLKEVDINLPKYDFLRPHVKLDGKTPQLSFWWMELKKE